MLIVAFNPGHDGAVAILEDRHLRWSIESEKDSFQRHFRLSPATVLKAAEFVDRVPDAVALGGWYKHPFLGTTNFGSGYEGGLAREHRQAKFFGGPITLFNSSHVRSHIMMGAGMAPKDEASVRAVLVYEGIAGSFFLLDERFEVTQEIPVLTHPGNRYGFLFALADPTFPDRGSGTRNEDAGKLMALAAYGDAADADADVKDTVERILAKPFLVMAPKHEFRDSPVYNAGVESDACKIAAALLTERMFEMFADAGRALIPPGTPLHISGGCGLNCDWNYQWRELGHFGSVFVPPCTDDSGSAVGTAIDALHHLSGDPCIEWDVYCGDGFEWDCEPDPAKWRRRPLDEREAARAIAEGQIFAWVQGRWEIGPRALGNRSILAEPFAARTKDRLNEIKQRDGYRPIAPCCRVEDLALVFNESFEDPYMLYFRTMQSDRFAAVTHVDGSARCQTVSEKSNPALHRLLSAFAEQSGVGILCNTSLNFKGLGFINRMSDLARFCELRRLDAMVVGDAWFERVPS